MKSSKSWELTWGLPWLWGSSHLDIYMDSSTTMHYLQPACSTCHSESCLFTLLRVLCRLWPNDRWCCPQRLSFHPNESIFANCGLILGPVALHQDYHCDGLSCLHTSQNVTLSTHQRMDWAFVFADRRHRTPKLHMMVVSFLPVCVSFFVKKTALHSLDWMPLPRHLEWQWENEHALRMAVMR